MNGCVIDGTPIAVDRFNVRDCPSVKVFFLTHAHSDHMVGLTSSWRSAIIHMTPVTARIVRYERQVSKEFIAELEIGASHAIHSEKLTKHEQFESFVVTVIDANHCPGSAMYLFQGSFGNILHTGDFRYDPSMLRNESLILCTRIDRLYLDNTYCDERCVFGSRKESADRIIKLIEEHPAKEVVIGITKLGKESLLVDIARHFHFPIVVTKERFAFFETLGCIPNVFSIEKHESRISAVNQWELFRNHSNDSLLIIPTALYSGVMTAMLNKKIVIVPYSDHSSYAELETFVSSVNPVSIIPIVNYKNKHMGDEDLSRRSDMSVFDKFLAEPLTPLCCSSSLNCKGARTRDVNLQASGDTAAVSHKPCDITCKRRKRSLGTTVQRQARVASKGVVYTDESSSESEVQFYDSSSESDSLSDLELVSTVSDERSPNGGPRDGCNTEDVSVEAIPASDAKDTEGNRSNGQEPSASKDYGETVPEEHENCTKMNVPSGHLFSVGSGSKNPEANSPKRLCSRNTDKDTDGTVPSEESRLVDGSVGVTLNVSNNPEVFLQIRGPLGGFTFQNDDNSEAVESSSTAEVSAKRDSPVSCRGDRRNTVAAIVNKRKCVSPRLSCRQREVLKDWQSLSKFFYETRYNKK